MEKKQLRAIVLYHFKLDHKTVKATRNMNRVLDKGATNELTVQHWFQKFRNEDFSIEKKEGPGRLFTVNF